MTSVQVHDTAPHLVVSAGRPLVSRRLRRRGPRSFVAVFRRSLRPAVRKREAVDDAAAPMLDVCGGAAALVAVHAGSPMASPDHGVELRAEVVCDNTRSSHADEAPCQAGASQFKDFSLLHCNIRGFISHRAELEGQLRLLPSLPSVICLNETFLDESTADAQLWLTGYNLLSRRDRRDGRSGGGIVCFVSVGFTGHIALLEHSVDSERTWHTIHSDIGPVLLGAWYRPPVSGEVSSIKSCDEEWQRLSGNFVATILAGDLNVHHRR